MKTRLALFGLVMAYATGCVADPPTEVGRFERGRSQVHVINAGNKPAVRIAPWDTDQVWFEFTEDRPWAKHGNRFLAQNMEVVEDGDKIRWLITWDSPPPGLQYEFQMAGNWQDFIYLYQAPWEQPYEEFERDGQQWLRKYNVDAFDVAERLVERQGSYSVYHRTKRNHIVGQTNYGNGGAFVIIPPRATDATGRREWCTMHIDEVTGTYSVQIPPGLTYPIVCNETFGPTFSGSGWGGFNANQARATGPLVLGEAGTGTSITFTLNWTDDEPVTFAIYPDSSSTPNTNYVANGVTSEGTVTSSVDHTTFTLTFPSSPTLSAGNYWLSIAHGQTNGSPQINYDTGSAYDVFYDVWTYSGGSHPNPFAGTELNGWVYNAYCTYTPSAPPAGGGGTQTIFISKQFEWMRWYMTYLKVDGGMPLYLN